MIRPKTLGLYQIRKILNLRHPSLFHSIKFKPLDETRSIPSRHTNSLIPTLIFRRNISISSQFQQELATHEGNKIPQKPDPEDGEADKEELTKKLRKLELELRRHKKDSTKETKTLETFFAEAVGLSKEGQNPEPEKGLKKLSNLFASADQIKKSRTECKKVEEVMVFKELSPDMAVFASYLHSKGYFVNANFLPNNKFDVTCFVNNYGRNFLKFAAEEFAKDHREIYKWLSIGDLKTVAQFGCPSLSRKTVFSAKAMRFCFGIREETEAAGYFFCLEDRALLCRKCDVSIHTVNSLVSLHQRFLLTGVRVGLEAVDPGASVSTGKSNTAEKIIETEKSHSVQARTVQMSATSQSNKVLPVGDFLPSKTSFTGGYLDDGIQQWQFDVFPALTDFSQEYNYLDNGSSKADSGKLAESDGSPILRAMEVELYGSDCLGQVADASFAVPEMSSPPTASGLCWPEQFPRHHHKLGSDTFVPDVCYLPAPNFYGSRQNTASIKRR